MPEYIYKATDRAGQVMEGSFDAADEAAVVARLRGMGCIPIRIEPAGRAAKPRAAAAAPKLKLKIDFKASLSSPFKRITGPELLAFTQELSTLIKAGLPLDRSLSVVSDITEGELLKGITEEVLRDVRGGKSLSEALGKHPKAFNRLYVNMIKAGEAGGILDVVLERLVDFLERSQELKRTVVNAMIYPIVLVFVMGIVVAVLLIFVVPRFVGIFEAMRQELPLPTKILLGFSTMVQSYWWLILGTGIGLYVWFRKWTASEKGKLTWDGFLLRLPVIRALILKIEVARLSRTLGTLITSGVPLLQSLGIVREIISNLIISNTINTIQKAVKEGKGVSLPMRSQGVFPPLAVHMIRVGEETGRMEEMLIRVADTYDREVQVAVKRALGLMEPLMILLMALVVGCIVISIVLALFSINEVAF
jgi:general secretion pathway protein F